MKKLLLFITLMFCSVGSIVAQEALQINSLFDGKYTDNPNATEIMMQGGKLSDYNLSDYHSVTIVNDKSDISQIERIIRHDGSNALEREVTYRNGGIYFAFYQLPKQNKLNRYIFYLNSYRNGGNKIMIVYLSGKASPKEIKSFINLPNLKK